MKFQLLNQFVLITDEISMFNKVLDKVASHRLAIGYISSAQNEAAIQTLTEMAEKENYYLGTLHLFTKLYM